MGIEYRIRFQWEQGNLDTEIRGLPWFAGYDAPHGLYFLRANSETMQEMPTAWVSIEPDGLYLCDNGGTLEDRAKIFRSVMDLALRLSERIEVELL